jgi:MoaA/NifB/PqqE/SkfB family radical SAM enzyme
VADDFFKKYTMASDYAKKKWESRATKKCDIDCKSVFEKSVHIDQFGKVFPCYIWLEESREKEWNGSHKEILDFKYECCQHCEKNTKKMLDAWGCELL